MEKLKLKEQKVLDYVKNFKMENGFAPSVRDICRDLNYKSTSTVHMYLNRLERFGYITKEDGKSRAITLNDDAPSVRAVPIVGTVAAGQPILAEQNFEGYVGYVGARGDAELFALKVKGESMIEAGILDGDLVIAEKTCYAENGEIVVALVEDEATVNKQLSASKDGSYTTIDLTDTSLVAVLNENDGYYHLGDTNGPVIFIDLTTDSKFVSSVQMICAHQRMGTYIYDINGKVSEKRSYNELFTQYGMPETTESVTEPIRVPLTEKLAEAIKSFGNKNSWWAEDSEANIFDRVLLGQPYNREFAWLLFCGYFS